MGQVRVVALAYYDAHQPEPWLTSNRAAYAASSHPFPAKITGQEHRAKVAAMLVKDATDELRDFLFTAGTDLANARVKITVRAESADEGSLVAMMAAAMGYDAELLA
jgi:hypothetical protein